jgi:hypothetical protein
VKDTLVRPSKCPTCGKMLNAAMSVEGNHSPSPGMITVCVYCAEILTYDPAMRLQKPTVKEFLEIQLDSSWPLVERTVRMVKEKARFG